MMVKKCYNIIYTSIMCQYMLKRSRLGSRNIVFLLSLPKKMLKSFYFSRFTTRFFSKDWKSTQITVTQSFYSFYLFFLLEPIFDFCDCYKLSAIQLAHLPVKNLFLYRTKKQSERKQDKLTIRRG